MFRGSLIGSGNTDNYGEKLFIDKVQEYLDDENIIYWNRQICGKEFDVCILMPGKGILVVELKGWREENILRVENNESRFACCPARWTYLSGEEALFERASGHDRPISTGEIFVKESLTGSFYCAQVAQMFVRTTAPCGSDVR